MNPTENIAYISLEPKTLRVKRITLYERRLRFRCKRCATFCCKLGGPALSLKDVESLKKAGRREAEFLDAAESSLRNEASGSCVFLEYDKEKDIYACTVYHHRPTLCRLYPFHLEKTRSNSFVLKIMPCRGISRRYGEPIDEKFIMAGLIDALHDLVSNKSFINAV